MTIERINVDGARRVRGFGLAVLMGAWTGCAAELELSGESSEDVPVVTESVGDGAFRTRVNATDDQAWVYLDMRTGEQAFPMDPSTSSDWHLAFRRTHVLSNGGVSGPGGCSVASVSDASFASLMQAPEDGYVEDQPDSDDPDDVVDSAFSTGEGWYVYDATDHTLAPRHVVYVLRTGLGQHFKLRMLGYYGPAGTGAFPSFDWAPLEGPQK